MDIDFYRQSTAFLYSILLGAALGVVYGPFKAARLAFFSSRASVIISDIIFMLLSTLSVFFFSLATLYGCVRIYVLIGALAGFLLYRNTLGRITSAIYCPIIALLKKISAKIRIILKNFTKKLLKISYNILYNINVKLSTFRNKRKSLSDNKKVMASNEKSGSKKGRRKVARQR